MLSLASSKLRSSSKFADSQVVIQSRSTRSDAVALIRPVCRSSGWRMHRHGVFIGHSLTVYRLFIDYRLFIAVQWCNRRWFSLSTCVKPDSEAHILRQPNKFIGGFCFFYFLQAKDIFSKHSNRFAKSFDIFRLNAPNRLRTYRDPTCV